MENRYDHLKHEASASACWSKNTVCAPTDQAQKGKKPFCIIMPPPNANDPLHLGHAMFVAVEDILIRYHRMLGEPTLWLPGTDHAGIETQFVFEKKLAKQNLSRFQFSRQELYQKIWQYVQDNSQVAVEQMQRLGASADFSRYKFTLDRDVVKFVTQTFIKMHQDNLIYRDLKLVNYCTKCGTSYSELEVKHIKQTTPLYYLKYGPFVLATTRPETKFADTAVAVHPDDKRYQKFIGQTIEVSGLNGKFTLKVIADEFVDKSFGTGAVKITPYHDFNDFEVWQRHKNEMPQPKQIVDFSGKLTLLAGQFAGLKVLEARQMVVAALQDKGLMEKIDNSYSNSVGVCYRCNRAIEPLPLPQFFVSVNHSKKSLTQKALKLLNNKKVKIHGAGKEKILRHWLKNLKDWNISRQITWGIPLPIWYQVDGFAERIFINFIDKNKKPFSGKLSQFLKTHTLEEIKAGIQSLQAEIGVPYQVGEEPKDQHLYIKETDTLDTWFSSAQWPVVTLKTNRQEDFARFYPTSVMETAYDILPFWVMRMMLMGVYLTKQEPFQDVYFHGLIRDSKGQKMSKSKGNVINPLKIVQKFGADALRFALIVRSTAGQDKSVAESDFVAARNFTNKIWNASRYVFLALEKTDKATDTTPLYAQTEKQHKQELQLIVKSITQKLKKLKVGQAADEVYYQFWHWFCDKIIEAHKQKQLSSQFLGESLVVFLKLLHPFVPFVTESIYQTLATKIPTYEKTLATSVWPQSKLNH